MRVEVNGVPVGVLTEEGPTARFREYRLPVPASVLALSPETTIRFSTEEGTPPAGRPADEARLSLRTLELRERL